jgi:hypothetical protein
MAGWLTGKQDSRLIGSARHPQRVQQPSERVQVIEIGLDDDLSGRIVVSETQTAHAPNEGSKRCVSAAVRCGGLMQASGIVH